jgi:hypothetical protein
LFFNLFDWYQEVGDDSKTPLSVLGEANEMVEDAWSDAREKNASREDKEEPVKYRDGKIPGNINV